MERLGKKDKAVIRAFTERRAMDGHKLDTDGTRLNIVGLGGSSTAYWKDGKIHLPDTGSRSGQLVQRAVAREAAPNDLYNRRGYNPDEDDADPMLYVDPEIGYRVMDWHGGQGTDLYALGSSSIAGNRVPQSVVEGAITDLERYRRKTRKRAEKRELGTLIDLLNEVAEGRHLKAQYNEQGLPFLTNPRVKNTHDPNRSARAFRTAVDRANEELVESANAGERGDVERLLRHIISAASWVGRAGAELHYAKMGADRIDPHAEAEYNNLGAGIRYWSKTTVAYMRDEMGIAANPRTKNQHAPAKLPMRGAPPKKVNAKEPPPKFKVGDRVIDDGRLYEVALVGEYDDYGGFRRYKLDDHAGHRKWHNDTNMRRAPKRRSRSR